MEDQEREQLTLDLFLRLPHEKRRQMLMLLFDGAPDELEAVFIRQLSRATPEQKVKAFVAGRLLLSQHVAEKQGVNLKTRH